MDSTLRTSPAAGGVAVPGVPTGLFVAGAWRDAGDGATFESIPPSSEERLETVTITLR